MDLELSSSEKQAWQWRVGEITNISYLLTIPDNLSHGRYSFVVGVYDWQTLERLKVSGVDCLMENTFIWLGDLVIDESGAIITYAPASNF
jgi:hypothetical protein